MPITLTMPALSPTMEEGALNKWLVKEGDEVRAGDIIAEIETDKATMEFEAVDEGRIGKLLVGEGEEGIPVNTPIAVMLEEGEDADALSGYTPEEGNAKPGAGEADAPPPSQGSDDTAHDQDPGPEEEPQKKSKSASDKKSAGKTATTNRTKSRSSVKREDGGRIFASPLARRIAAQNDLDLALLDGTGPNGRIVKRDVEAALESGVAEKPQEAKSAPAEKAEGKAAAAPLPFAEGSYEEIKHTPMRKTIARRITQSKQTIPHFYLTIDCALDALLALRRDLNDRAARDQEKPAYKLSVNDFIVRASALALRRTPDANASWTDSVMLRHKHADIGVAVAIDGGLITPIIRSAETKGLAEISNEMRDLAGRARERKLKPEEYEGGTFSISNLGMYGISEFSAVINPPHSMILAIGAAEQQPVVKDGAVAVATIMRCTLSCDHRVVDGALGAEFLNVFKGFIEDPVTMLL
ncbi:MAG TPA: pyruvate dehydrogenase complex dihydrolipoamide acetyltransferase [Alphaproteobacteria bacterium]|nr:pyruvate dehydrogenase complex dihydrolipoamide acetyltransferase [Alphaproteobacteria bacterium]HBF99527.1 pyruvate dehydrogenase complex dihydrolipoamide acetyltransferase [Alphaproteobacteria bacterium]